MALATKFLIQMLQYLEKGEAAGCSSPIKIISLAERCQRDSKLTANYSKMNVNILFKKS